MPTRGHVILPNRINEAYDAALESCRDIKASIKKTDPSTFVIDGRFPMSWLKNRFASDFKVILTDSEKGTTLSIYDFFVVAPDKKYIDIFFAAFAKRIPLPGSYQIEKVDQVPEAGREVGKKTVNIAVQGSALLFRPEQYAFNPALVRRSEYDIEIADAGNVPQVKDADTLVVLPIELGNTLQFRKKKGATEPLLQIPIAGIRKIEMVAESEGRFRKKDNLMLGIDFGASENHFRIVVDVNDKQINEIIGQVQKSKELEETYWKGFDLTYTYGDDATSNKTKIYFGAPFLAEGEDVLWEYSKVEGIVNKRLLAIAALTNFRAFVYFFDTHECGRVPLPAVDDVIVTNQQRVSNSNSIGTFTGRGGRAFSGVYSGTRSGSSQTIGDVVFMSNGRDVVTFSQVSDPHGLARLAKAAIKQINVIEEPISETDNGTKSNISSDISKSCSKCGHANPKQSRFCNKCGSGLQNDCGKCGQINPEDASFCNKCGFALR